MQIKGRPPMGVDFTGSERWGPKKEKGRERSREQKVK